MATPLARRLASDPVSKVEITIKCNNLLNKDTFSYSDPCVAVYLAGGDNVFHEIGRTETVKNNLNPEFTKAIRFDYYFEKVQKIRFLVYDIDNSTYDLSDDDFLGSLETTVGELVSNSPYTRPLFIKKTNKVAGKSTITIRTQELKNMNEVLQMSFYAKNLDKKDFLGKSDPYLEFYRKSSLVDKGTLVHRTEVIKNDLNPCWKPFSIYASRLGTSRDIIKVDCYDYDMDGSHDFIGSFETEVDQLKSAQNKPVEWACINPTKKAKKKNYKNSGVIYLARCLVSKEHSFLDYIFGGLQLNFTVAIDFTASNGHPSSLQSLHHLSTQPPNPYTRAIQCVGSVIQDYDSDRMFPALGFGARIPPNNEVSHCFPLSFNYNNPFCAGIDGILSSYNSCLQQIQLYGPTNFSPVINHVASFANNEHINRGNKNYFILLIITDGVISDMSETMETIVKSSQLPLSIIIIGVGSADFEAMEVLDGDGGRLRDARGNMAARDVVQFVNFSRFENIGMESLSREVLAEIPDQVVGYYKMMNISPAKPEEKPQKPPEHGYQGQINQQPNQQPPYQPANQNSPYPSSSSSSSSPYPLSSQHPNPSIPPSVQETANKIYPGLTSLQPYPSLGFNINPNPYPNPNSTQPPNPYPAPQNNPPYPSNNQNQYGSYQQKLPQMSSGVQNMTNYVQYSLNQSGFNQPNQPYPHGNQQPPYPQNNAPYPPYPGS